MKRCLDIFASFFGLLCLCPVLGVFLLLIWLQDFHSPFYIAPRVRRRGELFSMIKLRSMVVNADKVGGSSTATTDRRVTWVGRLIRRYKLDEFSQLWNVLKGEMSLVGPRPQVQSDVNLYSDEEYHLFDVKPGITDFSSIVFSDEGEILKGSSDPDQHYNHVIRPWKSRLGLFYVKHHSISVDLWLVALTVIAIILRPKALAGVQRLLRKRGADEQLIQVAGRSEPLVPYPPPGMQTVETRTSTSQAIL
jgi:lipopolysaccharide/colanic/teichoic acid biosynthesis glycosyltransferase